MTASVEKRMAEAITVSIVGGFMSEKRSAVKKLFVRMYVEVTDRKMNQHIWRAVKEENGANIMRKYEAS